MDTAFSEDQVEIARLADTVLDRVASGPVGESWFDLSLWRDLSQAGLVGMPLSDDVGGGARGVVEMAIVLERIGMRAAPVPYHATVVAAMAVDRFGSTGLRAGLLPRAATGEMVLTLALAEPGAADPLHPRTTATRVDEGWRLEGIKTCVPCAGIADVVLVLAAHGSEVGVFVVPVVAPGVGRTMQLATTGEPQARVSLADVVVDDDALLGAGAATALLDIARVGQCALQLGCSTSALKLAAGWVAQREQFGRRLSEFQVVRTRLADAFIALDGCRLTTWQAAWRLDHGSDARDEVRIAKYWAAEASTVVTLTAHRLHGGVGMDPAGPLAPFTLLSRQLEFSLGSARQQLRELGDSLATAAVATS